MSAEEVWIYLDVDGVFNAITGSLPQWGWGCEADQYWVNRFSIVVASDLVAEVNALAEKPHVRMHWLTTWEDDAPKELCRAIGLNGQSWPVLHNEPRHEPDQHAWWKLNAIREHLPEGQRAIWIDDDIRFDRAAIEWLRLNPNVVAVSPRTELGVTRRQMRLIAESAS